VNRSRLLFGIPAALACLSLLSPQLDGQTSAQMGAPQLPFVFEEQVTLAADFSVGETPIGKRNIVPITGGTFEGPGIRGKIMPGGWDWQLTHPSGCFDLHADYMIQTDDGVIIHVINQGMICPNSSGKHDALFTSPAFEAPKGKYDWLNGGVYVGTVDGMKIDGKPAVRIRFFKAYADQPSPGH
jgi:hypothetical protein